MKRLILILVCLIVITPSQAEDKKNGQTEQIQQQLRIQDERLTNIDEQVLMKRRQIDVWYERELSELRQLAARKVRQLKPDNRALWTEFIKMHGQTSEFDTYFKMNDQIPHAYSYFMNTTLSSPIATTSTIFIRDTDTFDLRAALADGYFLSAAANLLLDPNFRKRLADLADGSPYNPQSLLVRMEARKLLYVVDDFQSKLAALQVRREAKLAALEQWKQDLKADVFRVMRETTAAPETVDDGVVSAILYSQDSPLCMVDGLDRIFKEGDSIGSIVIVKINPDHVEFSKGSQTWTQLVGKPAGAAWQ
jgi:hypothetical protein